MNTRQKYQQNTGMAMSMLMWTGTPSLMYLSHSHRRLLPPPTSLLSVIEKAGGNEGSSPQQPTYVGLVLNARRPKLSRSHINALAS